MNDNDVLTVCEIKVSYQPKIKASDRPVMQTSQDLYKLFIDKVFDPDTIELKEFFKVALLNSACKLLGVHHLSEGGSCQTIVDIKHIMQAAILANAKDIVLCHNHPSGSLYPSSEDDLVTRKVQEACNIMGFTLMDHLIIASEKYYSYADEGRLL
ncbi:MAG: JAB domain-containing protein [Candidatus Symbiothrix sp.]|nr:JAB domain-containing protein [Candidatus Symbiothrix sp.]